MSPSTLLYAAVGGILPALVWLLFWLREDRKRPEPKYRIAEAFIAGMATVLLVLPIQTSTHASLSHFMPLMFLVWAALEEILKYGACYITALHTESNDEPIDPLIYMLTTALGFSAMENTLFLLNPLMDGNVVETIVTGNMRFIGASLLHVLSSGVIGLFIALSFYGSRIQKRAYLAIGIAAAIALHTIFNLFIIKDTDGTAFAAFGAVWMAVIVLMLLFEKVKRIYPRT